MKQKFLVCCYFVAICMCLQRIEAMKRPLVDKEKSSWHEERFTTIKQAFSFSVIRQTLKSMFTSKKKKVIYSDDHSAELREEE